MSTAPPLPILTFHALDERTDLCGFPPAVFREGLAHLHRAGHRTLALADAVAALRRGESLPPRAFVLTFDDGYRSVYDEALPVLRAHGMTATVFLTVGTPDAAATRERLPAQSDRAMLSWAEIGEMQRAGIAFGAHSLTHPDLTQEPLDRITAEVGLSRTIIEQRLGTAVTGFAYPFGRYDRRSRAVVQDHFDFACSDAFGFASPASDPWALERIDMFYLRSPRRFTLVASPWFPACVHTIATARAVRRRLR